MQKLRHTLRSASCPRGQLGKPSDLTGIRRLAGLWIPPMNTTNLMSIVPRLVTRTAGCALTLLVAALFLTTFRTQAHHNEIITSFGVTNYTGYVLDSDALWGLDEYNRESLLAREVVQY